MKKSTWYRDLLVMLAALCVAGVAVVWVQRITGRIDGVAMLIFMLAVFVTSMYTDGYLWGVLASLASVLAVNFAFFTPYFAFNFTLPENLFSGLVMLAVSIMTSTLTTRVKKQEQLRMETEREKMRANLLRAVSHDLRTPLTSIYGACSTVTENYDSLGKEQALKLLREACEDAQWLNRMVENLLSVTRFDGEQVAVKKTPTVLEELLDAVLVKFKKRCPDVPVQLELPEDFVMIPMDSMLIQQVLMNLLENAALHAEGMTKLTLRVFTMGGRAVLVWDAEFHREKIGEMPTEMFLHFFKSLSDAARMNLNIKAEGNNEHHKIEGIFKALARAIKMAVRRDIYHFEVPSSKGCI